ncbi:ester cyclase [Acuticoccus sediminis]|uniref:Ester cyclase n=1 Tax=Acuticoccus sediminis TaxID=2184697 RepID=A0A8B2NZ38_9HYPH|nr:ester cyclase [Acuticoccus sediminis]RAI04101.1 ester cyclase [Acuticoccus sediminis]
MPLEATYRAYIAALNAQDYGALDRYVAEHVVYNGETLTREQYTDQIRRSYAALEGLAYVIDQVVTSGDDVAARLVFDVVPVAPFFGVAPTGRRAVFAEHVFYRFQAGRIVAVSSLIDRAGYAEQLGASTLPPE